MPYLWERLLGNTDGKGSNGGGASTSLRLHNVCIERRQIKMARCIKCGKPIVWIRTTKGKSMPCDADPVAYREERGGKEKIVTPNGEVISGTFDAKPEEMTGIGYIPHWSTCPQANSFRKR